MKLTNNILIEKLVKEKVYCYECFKNDIIKELNINEFNTSYIICNIHNTIKENNG